MSRITDPPPAAVVVGWVIVVILLAIAFSLSPTSDTDECATYPSACEQDVSN